MKILILESQLIVASDVSLQLSKLGYDVIGINTRSEDAFKTIERNRPNLVLMNIEMQGNGSESGISIARIISETLKIPVVFLSAHSGRKIFEHVIKAHPYAFIAKPFDNKGLQRGIETALDRMVVEQLWEKENRSVRNEL